MMSVRKMMTRLTAVFILFWAIVFQVSASAEDPLGRIHELRTILHKDNGEFYYDTLEITLYDEDTMIPVRVLPVLASYKLGDDRTDKLLADATKKVSPEVAVMLVHLLEQRGAAGRVFHALDDFDSLNGHLQEALVGVVSRNAGADYLPQIMEWSVGDFERVAKSGLRHNFTQGLDEAIFQKYVSKQGIPVDHQVAALDILRERGAITFKSEIMMLLDSKTPVIRQSVVACLREWLELEDLAEILEILKSANDAKVQADVSRLYVTVATTRLTDKAEAIKLLDAKLSSDEYIALKERLIRAIATR